MIICTSPMRHHQLLAQISQRWNWSPTRIQQLSCYSYSPCTHCCYHHNHCPFEILRVRPVQANLTTQHLTSSAHMTISPSSIGIGDRPRCLRFTRSYCCSQLLLRKMPKFLRFFEDTPLLLISSQNSCPFGPFNKSWHDCITLLTLELIIFIASPSKFGRCNSRASWRILYISRVIFFSASSWCRLNLIHWAAFCPDL